MARKRTMGERKKLTMYYPPDFDPRLVPRQKREKNFTCEVRMMLPFSVQCNRCGEVMYMGKKFIISDEFYEK